MTSKLRLRYNIFMYKVFERKDHNNSFLYRDDVKVRLTKTNCLKKHWTFEMQTNSNK